MDDRLVSRISKDLNISAFSDENDKSFGNRLIYSAIASWIRMLVLGKSYIDMQSPEETEYPNVDINHIQNRASQVSYGLLQSISHEDSWVPRIVEDQGSELTSTIIRNMKFCYEISELNDKRRLTASPRRIASSGKMCLHMGGFDWNNNSNSWYTVGLGRWELNVDLKTNIRTKFTIPNANHETFLIELIKDATWKEKHLKANYQIFKTGSDAFYRNAWKEIDNKKIPYGISLLRNIEEGGFLLVRREVSEMSVSLLDSWYYQEKELFRIMYALDAEAKTPAQFKVECKEDYVVLHCHSNLPNAEARLLHLSSWPKRNYRDDYYRIMPIKQWKLFRKILENLGISVVLG